MAKARGHKTKGVHVRLTPVHFDTLEKVAVVRNATISDVVRELIERFGSDVARPYQTQSSAGDRQVMARAAL